MSAREHTFEEREEALKRAPPHKQALYDGPQGGVVLKKVFDEYHLRPELYAACALTFGDVVLGLEPEEQLPALIGARVGLPEKLATLIAHELLEAIYQSGAAAEGRNASAQPPQQPIPILPPQAPSWREVPGELPHIHTADSTNTIPPKPLTDLPRYVKDDPYREPPK